MRYWYDCEFIEDGKTIDLISIGIVCEDGREYYAQSTEFRWQNANSWVREHVLPHLRYCSYKNHMAQSGRAGSACLSMAYHQVEIAFDGRCGLADCPWRTRKQLMYEVAQFLQPKGEHEKFELWGYYSAYDHVALAQLFGTMMDLPQGFPMYTRDIKQWCDQLGDPLLPAQNSAEEHNALADAKWNKLAWEYLQTVEERRYYGEYSTQRGML